jgi:tRNA (adenine22-N1)-methyltransferase
MASQRLQTLASLCPTHGPLVDIGSDHGQLLAILFRQGFNFALYGSELSSSSFQSLKKSVEDYPFRLYQADGLSHLPSEVITVVIAGMGGLLIIEMLTKGNASLSTVQTLVLGPQRDVHKLRHWLADHGWMITEEKFVLEADQGYPLLVAQRGQMRLTDIEASYGPILIKHRDPVFLNWLRLEQLSLSKALALHDNKDKQTRLDWINHYVNIR